jgi:phage replication O-like protein O
MLRERNSKSMANPQKEDGFTAIANEIMDALAHIRIPGEERQILDVILRKTYGFQKCEDYISLSQFMSMTGIKKPNVIRAIRGLTSKKMITVIKKDNAVANLFKFNKNFDQWEALSKKITLSKKIMTFIKKDNASLSKKIPTKENTTKETITKEKTYVANADALRLAELLFSEIIKQNLKSRLLTNNNGKRQKIAQKWAVDIEKLILIDKQEPSTVEEVILFATHDNFWGANILSGRKLREKWDTLTRRMNGNRHSNSTTDENSKFAGIAAWLDEKQKESEVPDHELRRFYQIWGGDGDTGRGI